MAKYLSEYLGSPAWQLIKDASIRKEIFKLINSTRGRLNSSTIQNFADNAAAITGGLVVGDIYRNGDILQIVH